MQKLFGVLILLLMITFQAKSQNAGMTYEQSLEIWEQMRDAHQNSYTYVDEFMGMAGTTTTEVKVKNGLIIRKTVILYDHSGKILSRKVLKKTKAQKDALTIDQIYAFARTEVLPKKKQPDVYAIYFETDNAGLLKQAGYREVLCADDCFQGFTLREIRWE